MGCSILFPHSFIGFPIWFVATWCGLATCSPCLPSPSLLCSPQVLHVCIGFDFSISLSLSLSLAHSPFFFVCAAHFVWFVVDNVDTFNMGDVDKFDTFSTHREKYCMFNLAIYITSPGCARNRHNGVWVTIDCCIYMYTNIYIYIYIQFQFKNNSALAHMHSQGENMQCDIQAWHHMHTPPRIDDHPNVVMCRMQHDFFWN